MPIIYTCIARAKDATILVESTAPELGGNAPQISLALMEYIRDHPDTLPEDVCKTWLQQNEATKDFFGGLIEACTGGYDSMDGTEHYFHTLKRNGVIYSCLSDDHDPREQNVNFDFLKRMQTELTQMFRPGRISRANAYALDKPFAPNIRTALHYYNINHQKLTREQKVQNTLNDIENMKEILGRNIQLVLRQTVSVEKMLKKSEQAQENTIVFKKKAHQLHSKIWRQHNATRLILLAVVLFFIYIILAMSCGLTLTECRRQTSGGDQNNNAADQSSGDDQAAAADGGGN